MEDKVLDLLSKFEQLVIDIAPHVLELGLFTARVAAGQSLFKACLLFILTIGFAVVSVKFFKQAVKEQRKEERGDPEDKYYAGGGIFAVAATVLGIILLVNSSIWSVIGVFYPEVWIAKEVLGW